MPKAIITVGISASGKTTWAEEYQRQHRNTIISNRDDLKFNLYCGRERNWNLYKFSKGRENKITEIQESEALFAWEEKREFILSDTNLNPKFRKKWVDYLSDLGFDVEIKDFPISWEEAIKRDQLRPNSVGYKVINKQWKQWLEYIGHKKYIPDTSFPAAVIVDVDGTLANMKGVRSPYEWDKVGLDNPIQIICDMVNGLYRDYYIIVVSGRDGCCEEATMIWLTLNCIDYDDFYIRKEGDTRKDTIVKEEIFWNHIANEYNVEAVIDDRPSMCRMWRDLGLKVIQVADPYDEF